MEIKRKRTGVEVEIHLDRDEEEHLINEMRLLPSQVPYTKKLLRTVLGVVEVAEYRSPRESIDEDVVFSPPEEYAPKQAYYSRERKPDKQVKAIILNNITSNRIRTKTELCNKSGADYKRVAKLLKSLVRSGQIEEHKKGKSYVYSLTGKPLLPSTHHSKLEEEDIRARVLKVLSEVGSEGKTKLFVKCHLAGQDYQKFCNVMDALITDSRVVEDCGKGGRGGFKTKYWLPHLKPTVPAEAFVNQPDKTPTAEFVTEKLKEPVVVCYNWSDENIGSFIVKEVGNLMRLAENHSILNDKSIPFFTSWLEDFRGKFKQRFPHSAKPEIFYNEELEREFIDEFSSALLNKYANMRVQGRYLTKLDWVLTLSRAFGISVETIQDVVGKNWKFIQR